MLEYEMTNIWTQYGLKSSPYFVNPLDPTKSSLFPISLFTGRQKEGKIVLDRIASSDNSRIVIEGLPGVGKTTFIHNIKYIASEKNGYLTFYDHIRITQDYTSIQFIVDMINNTLLALYRNFPKRISEFETDEAIQNAKRLVTETTESQWSFGANAFGLGGNVGHAKTHILPIFQPQQFYSMLENLVIAIKSFGFKGIIIHINNLENLCSENLEVARRFFNDIRDFLMVPGYHFIVGAKLGFVNEVFGKEDRVRSIFPIPTVLEPLDINDTHDLLKKRYDYLKIDNTDFILPVEDEVIDNYHKLFQGDLRSMFSTISDAIELRGQQLQPQPLQYSLINPILQQKYEQYLRTKFTDSAGDILFLLKDEKIPFNQTDVRKETDYSQGRISQIFSELDSGGGVTCIGQKGKKKFYDLSGISKIAFGKTT